MSNTTFNGHTKMMDYPTQAGVFTYPGPGFKQVYVRNRACAVIFEAMSRRWHDEVEPVAASHPDNWFKPRERKSTTTAGKPDLIAEHGYRPPATTVGTGDNSNHRSGTAIDINGHLHPYEATTQGTYRDGFTQKQRDKVREIAKWVKSDSGKSLGRSGLDFAVGKRDGMHLEIAPGVSHAEMSQAAKRLENFVGRSSTIDSWWEGAKGLDVRGAQTILANHYAVGAADGKAGPKTTAAIKSFQQDFGLVVDGKVGPLVRAALRQLDEGEFVPGAGQDEGKLTVSEVEELKAQLKSLEVKVVALTAAVNRVDASVDLLPTPSAIATAVWEWARLGHGQFNAWWWLRRGAVLNPEHKQFPADPGSPADIERKTAETVLGHRIEPYTGL